MNERLSRLAPKLGLGLVCFALVPAALVPAALVASLVPASLAAPAAADDPVAETVRKWGLLGPWSVDCRLPPDHANGTVLAYEIGPDGSVIYRRDFGDVSDENQVLTARVSADGLLNLEIYFPAIKQKRDVGLMLQPDGSLRAIYNRDEKGEYTIKDGKFIATKKPTPAQHKCEPPASPNPEQSRD